MITRPSLPRGSFPLSDLCSGRAGHPFTGKYINKIKTIVKMGNKEDGIIWVDALIYSSPLPTFTEIILSPDPSPHDTLKTPTPLMQIGASTHDRTRGEYKNRVSEGATGYHPLFTGPGKAIRGRITAHQGQNRADDRKGDLPPDNGLIRVMSNSPPFLFLGVGA